LSRRTLVRGCRWKSSEKTRGRWKISSVNLSIYRGEAGSFKKLPRFDRCEFSGGHVSTPTFWGWHFFTKVRKFSWKRIVGVNPLPRGASVGGLGKTNPRNAGLSKFMERVRESGGIKKS
jgi:hypothetical protein